MLPIPVLAVLLLCIQPDYALPVVPTISYPGDEWNLLLLGVAMMIGMGAVFACVRCRRKKRGFELDHDVEAQEFKNEGAKDTHTATTVEAIRTEFPIFQALSTPSSPQFQPLDNESNLDSRDDLHVDQVDILDELNSSSGREKDKFESEGYQEKAPSPLAEDSIVLTFETSEIPEAKQFVYESLATMEMETETGAVAVQEDAEYNSSLEQALRELDIAIGGENDDPVEEEDSDTEGEQPREVDTDDHFENVLRQLFIDNMLSSLSSAEGEVEMEEEPPPTDDDVIESTANNELLENRGEAEKDEEDVQGIAAEQVISQIVDSLVEDCCTEVIVERNLERPKKPSPPDDEEMGEMSEEEPFFDKLPAICQSTPSVSNKRSSAMVVGEEEEAGGGGGGKAKHSLFFGDEVLSPVGDETFAVEELKPSNGIPTVTVCQGEENLADKTFEVAASAVKTATAAPGENYLRDGNATITPVNTPIEVQIDAEGEATFTKDLAGDEPLEIGGMSGGWFLHPQEVIGDETFDFANLPPPPPPLEMDGDDDFHGGGFYDDDDEDFASSRANMDFDALRKQLADLLPHAQGAPAPDDDGAVGGSCESGMSASVLEAMLNNIDPTPPPAPETQNFKRALSPIMEESEEENTTIKTSILNDTKNLDSTSTGCNETLSEAVMGVTRTLMASNDTLFNFEDTLGDREDLTPTPMAGGSFSVVVKSPVNGTFVLNESVTPVGEPKSDSTFVMPEEPRTKPMTLDLSAVRPDNYSNALDVTSPEQLKTFSEDLTSVEHVSGSDASGKDLDGTYTTNTIEMETCISLNKDEGEECDLVEDLEKDTDRDSEDEEEEEEEEESKEASTQMETNEVLEVKEAAEEVIGVPEDALEQTKLFLAREIDQNRWYKVSSNQADATVFHVTAVEQDSLELEMPIEKCLTGTGKSLPEDDGNNNVTFDYNENCHNGHNGLGDSSHQYLSGEEDPWLATPGGDEHVNGHDPEEPEELVTVFNGEWDKESAEDSDNNELTDQEDGASIDTSDDSSEEFMYVQGKNLPGNGEAASAWDTHVDQVPVAQKEESKFETVAEEPEEEEGEGEEEEEGASDADGEFIPSCWSSSAKPSRSAMKSPDKSSSDEDSKDGKRRARNVAFKKQQYHNVYEYPREMNPLSPSLSEPTFSVNFRDQASPHAQPLVGDLDGFMISSSTRPFQSNQCNTWPTESDFSWSQHMSSDDGSSPLKLTEGTVVYSEIPIEWPRRVIVDADGDDSGSESNPVLRPDSGVGESAECLNEATTLGELCHAKASLRLPLINPSPPLLSAAAFLKPDDQETENSDEEFRKESSDENAALPTPSCTGSMDSLSSSSCSDRQMISFTTFGKITPQSSVDEQREQRGDGQVVDSKLTKEGEAENEQEAIIEGRVGVISEPRDELLDKYRQGNRVSDSTDEDSGIENISRKIH